MIFKSNLSFLRTEIEFIIESVDGTGLSIKARDAIQPAGHATRQVSISLAGHALGGTFQADNAIQLTK